MQSFFFWANEKNIFNFCLFPFFAKLNSAQLKLQLQLELSIALIYFFFLTIHPPGHQDK